MTQRSTELSRRLVIGHKRDGRCCYDKEAKRELIEACLRPGVSIARMGLEHGVNANLLRTWIARYRRQGEVGAVGRAQEGASEARAFVPVVAVGVSSQSSVMRLGARLPNGVKLDLGALGSDDLALMLRLLCELPCSGSTPE